MLLFRTANIITSLQQINIVNEELNCFFFLLGCAKTLNSLVLVGKRERFLKQHLQITSQLRGQKQNVLQPIILN